MSWVCMLQFVSELNVSRMMLNSCTYYQYSNGPLRSPWQDY